MASSVAENGDNENGDEHRSVERRALPPLLAAFLVFLSSGAVLVLEIVGLRLVAPYVGVTLQTSSSVIGVALAAIAFGAWSGGRMADMVNPRRMLVPVLGIAGVATTVTLPLVRYVGEALRGGAASAVLPLTFVAVFVPAALLSTVTPMVVKLQLADLGRTGTVVGRLSSIGTLGAIAATFGTGFVLVAALPSSVIVVGLGTLLVFTALGLGVYLRRSGLVRPELVAAALAGTGLTLIAPSPCDVETAYHCARVAVDPERPSGRYLYLDTLAHSYVDLADPTYLEFPYIKAIASVADVSWPSGRPLSALHLGGGGLTMPRYLAATRPGGDNLVLEIDAGVVALDRQRLDLEEGPQLDVRVGDARVGLAEEATASRDLVVGDAFGGVAVPWHLTTRETVAEVDRVLVDDGVYVVNLIDHPPNRFVRAEVATLAAVFPHVAVIARPEAIQGRDGGNLVAVASRRPLSLGALRQRLDERGSPFTVIVGPEVARFVGGADVLTDDHAPVDQLLTPYPS